MTELMTPQEVADLFRVHVRTVNLWAAKGKLESTKSPGGQNRFRRSDVERLLRPEEVSA